MENQFFNMNNLKRLLYFIVVMAAAMSCSDDDPQPSVENAKFSLADSAPIALPSAITSSEDEHAQMVVGWAMSANAMTSYTALFTPPAGAEKSTTAITPSNGRTNGTNESVVVYTWSQQGFGAIAYQIRDLSDKFAFEILMKEEGTADWYRYVYAEEKKDGSAGYMEFYAGEEVAMRWDWTRSGSTLAIDFSTGDAGLSYSFVIDTNTSAGSIVVMDGEEKIYESTWTAAGTGTWKEYFDGELVASGEW